MKKHFKEPRQITIRYTGDCVECGTILKEGSSAYYWPSDGRLYCKSCGESGYRQFLSATVDETVYNRFGNPMK